MATAFWVLFLPITTTNIEVNILQSFADCVITRKFGDTFAIQPDKSGTLSLQEKLEVQRQNWAAVNGVPS